MQFDQQTTALSFQLRSKQTSRCTALEEDTGRKYLSNCRIRVGRLCWTAQPAADDVHTS